MKCIEKRAEIIDYSSNKVEYSVLFTGVRPYENQDIVGTESRTVSKEMFNALKVGREYQSCFRPCIEEIGANTNNTVGIIVY